VTFSCTASLLQVAKAHTGVSIGSYPNTASGDAADAYKVKLAFTSRDAGALDAALAAARAALPETFELDAAATQ
jgi:hypothetical protein